jgi:hypothetical protein
MADHLACVSWTKMVEVQRENLELRQRKNSPSG